ncbi:MAG: hypothetical protein JJLCMIEE_03326 [Acidimicrobiales bacterium]|nr:MAG: peptidase S8 [Actinomycetota bacterium]MBV6510196.1 hypothetical protein [Acidimicrobiales bacterium]RIK03523.1 MAG: peptidase S8 [Acidobacteriota bacterium]
MHATTRRVHALVVVSVLALVATLTTSASSASAAAGQATDGTERVIVALETGSAAPTPAQIDAAAADVVADVAGSGADEIETLEHVPVMTMSVDASALADLEASDSVQSIQEDRVNFTSLVQSTDHIGATDAWSLGFTGDGQTVAIIDTGVDKSHSWLDGGKVVAEGCFTTTDGSQDSAGVCPGGNPDYAIGPGAGAPCPFVSTYGDCDHGTHVAGIAAGDNPSGGGGVAPDADIIAVQIFSRFDSGCPNDLNPCAGAWTSDIIAGLDYVYSLRNTYDIASANLSLGGGYSSGPCDSDPIKASVDALRNAGIATIVASGNSGWKSGMSSPACISSSVAVGATADTNDTVQWWSNSSSALDLLAPGASITSSVPGGGTATWSGTSMATPHVTGAWAVVAEADPAASVSEIEAALESAGVSVTDPENGRVTPRIDLPGALGYDGEGDDGDGGGSSSTPVTSYWTASEYQSVLSIANYYGFSPALLQKQAVVALYFFLALEGFPPPAHYPAPPGGSYGVSSTYTAGEYVAIDVVSDYFWLSDSHSQKIATSLIAYLTILSVLYG